MIKYINYVVDLHRNIAVEQEDTLPAHLQKLGRLNQIMRQPVVSTSEQHEDSQTPTPDEDLPDIPEAAEEGASSPPRDMDDAAG